MTSCASYAVRGIARSTTANDALLYTQLQRIAEFVTYDVAGLVRVSQLGSAVEF